MENQKGMDEEDLTKKINGLNLREKPKFNVNNNKKKKKMEDENKNFK